MAGPLLVRGWAEILRLRAQEDGGGWTTQERGCGRRIHAPIASIAAEFRYPGDGLVAAGGARHFLHVQPDTGGHPRAVLGVALREVRHHPLLDLAVALLQVIDQIVDQVVALPGLDRAVALTRLLVGAVRSIAWRITRPSTNGSAGGATRGACLTPPRLFGS